MNCARRLASKNNEAFCHSTARGDFGFSSGMRPQTWGEYVPDRSYRCAPNCRDARGGGRLGGPAHSERGRAEAIAMGAQIRANGISFTRIVSSPWCRCVETAKLMDLGPVDIEPAFSNAFVLRDRREELRHDATSILNTWADGTLMVV